MKRQITLGEALGFALTIVIIVISAWITQSNEAARHDERIKILEYNKQEIKNEIKDIRDGQASNFKILSEKLEAIRLLIERKQDRK